MNEVWKTIKGWDNFLISNFGNVKSVDRKEPFLNTTRIRFGRVIKTRVLRKYVCVSLKQNCKQKTFLVHRLVAEYFVEKKSGDIVNHIDANRFNNVFTNLEWCSQKENIHHAMKFDNWTKGEKHGCSKLTESQVLYIRDSEEGGFRLAKRLNVSYTTVKRIRARKIWKHL